MSGTTPPLPPAFYAAQPREGGRHSMWSDWTVVLHPPYTLWHLSYVAIGGSIAPRFDGGTLAATLVAFFLAVGVCAHSLDELHGRPLRTHIPSWQLVTAGVLSLGAATALGIIGLDRVGLGLAVFIVVGIVLTCGYNLELFGGRLHNDTTFALAWGAFPVLTAYYAQARTIGPVAVLAAVACYLLSNAQRTLSTPARQLRRRVQEVRGETVLEDGSREPLTVTTLLAPLETALMAMAWSVAALAAALVVFRSR